MREAERLVARIARRTRNHSAIARGVGVRGTIAFQEILNSLTIMREKRTLECIARAALITLPPRISVRGGGDAAAIISDIVQEELYGMRSFAGGDGVYLSDADLSPGEFATAIDQLSPLPQPQAAGLSHGDRFAVVPELRDVQETSGRGLGKGAGEIDPGEEYSQIKKSLLSLLTDLERRMWEGKISPQEYEEQKAGIMAQLEKAARSRLQMSRGELAGTIIEMMDAQDRQWNRDLSFDTMHVYYHVKGTCEGTEMSPFKQDYHALKWLIDDLRGKSILKPAENTQGLLLTGFALELLLDYLTDRLRAGEDDTVTLNLDSMAAAVRGNEIRRFSTGDAFRDLSVRHTIREIVRQKKDLRDVSRSDLRVFMKENQKPQMDMILCVDTSGSMGFHQKLTYARLAAAGVARAGLKDGNRVGLVAFNDRGQTMVTPSREDRGRLFDAIAGLTASGNTNIGDGIRAATDLFMKDRVTNSRQIILITDGLPSAISEHAFSRLKISKARDLTEESALYEAQRARAAGVRVSIVYIAPQDQLRDPFIKNMARIGGGKMRRVSNPSDFNGMPRLESRVVEGPGSRGGLDWI